MVFFLTQNGGETMPKKEQKSTMQVGNTVFHVTSRFLGIVELQHVIKRLIQKEMEQGNC